MSENFALNTNILETNILNLIVVIGVLVYFGRDIVSSILETRIQRIGKSLIDAQEKYEQMEKELTEAKMVYSLAQEKANTIRNQSTQTWEERSNFLAQQTSEEIERLTDSQLLTIRLQKDKNLQLLTNKAQDLIILNAREKMKRQLLFNRSRQFDIFESEGKIFAEHQF